jgi:hypothetical protein
MAPGLAWDEQVAESARFVLRQFTDLLSRYGLVEEGRFMFPVVFRREVEQGRDPRFGISTNQSLREVQSRDDDFRVVGKAKPVEAVQQRKLSGRCCSGFGVARNYRPIDRAFHSAVLNRHGDLLRDGLPNIGSLVHGWVRLAHMPFI